MQKAREIAARVRALEITERGQGCRLWVPGPRVAQLRRVS
jgi:hypothetical protein